jgi:hypothetical protein
MARVRLKYVNGYPNYDRPDGRVRYYFRRGRGAKAIPLPGIPGSEEFMAAYGAALASTSNAPEVGASRTAPGTINALVANYYKSAAWLDDIGAETRRRRRSVIEGFREKHGDKRVALLRQDHFQTMLGEIRTPASKVNWLKTIRALMKSGVPTMLRSDPTAGLTVKGGAKSKPHHMWLDEEIERYRAYWPLGTMQRLVLELALETVSRRGEVVRLGPQHLYRGKDGKPRIKIARIKGSRDVDMPMSDALLAACLARPKTGLARDRPAWRADARHIFRPVVRCGRPAEALPHAWPQAERYEPAGAGRRHRARAARHERPQEPHPSSTVHRRGPEPAGTRRPRFREIANKAGRRLHKRADPITQTGLRNPHKTGISKMHCSSRAEELRFRVNTSACGLGLDRGMPALIVPALIRVLFEPPATR